MIKWMSEIGVVKEGMGNETMMYNKESGNFIKQKDIKGGNWEVDSPKNHEKGKETR